MRPKLRTPNLRRSASQVPPQAPARLSVSLLLWFAVGLLLPWLFSSMGLNRQLTLTESHDSSEQSQSGSDSAHPPEFSQENSQENTSPATAPLTSDRIYQKAKPFVVEVWVSTTGIVAPAAGIALTPDGLVLTNYHVIHEAAFDFVRSANGKDFDGTVIAVDPALDLALIQLQGAAHLPAAKLSHDSSQVKVGDTVYAIGSPLGSHWKMTEAEIIEVNSECGLPNLQCLRTPAEFLKPGNSGGPLLDSAGQVVGINRAIQDGTGEGVSIPIETVKQFVNQTQGLPN